MSRSPDLAEEMMNDPILFWRYWDKIPESDGVPTKSGMAEGQQFKDGLAWREGKAILYVWIDNKWWIKAGS